MSSVPVFNLDRDPKSIPKNNHILISENNKLDRIEFDWEGVSLPCHSFYDVLATVLSILGAASTGNARHSHHLALLIILAKFLTVIAGNQAKTLAPRGVSIMFTNEAVNPDGLNIIMGASIPAHDALKDVIRQSRYKLLAQEGSFALLGMYKAWYKWPCGQCAETFALVLLKR